MAQGNPSTSDDIPGTGFLVFRASRLEALIGPLWTLMDRTWPDNVLQPHTVIAAHPGMKQWLGGALARHMGPQGIAANLDIVLPSAWIERQSQKYLDARAVALPHYQSAQLRWSIHELLGDIQHCRGFESYLAAEASPAVKALRRFQLADRLAGIYSQYLVYRPDWLQAWEDRNFSYAGGNTPESERLGRLWHKLQSRLGNHRGHAMQNLVQTLNENPQERSVLHVFGVSHLAPSEIGVLRAYAAHGLVAMFLPDPCREYWGGGLAIKEPAACTSYRKEEQARLEAAGAGDYWSAQGHPLLARWGRLGQHFFSEISDGSVIHDGRHGQDEANEAPVNRLERLQESIRRLEPGLMKPDDDAAAELEDVSLRVHACHTRQRELEVLRDVMLDALDSGIPADGMMVMAPDIGAYLPLIPSVFGEPGTARERRLPYHLADAPVSLEHGLFALLRRLLTLSTRRITAPEVADLLAVPEIQRRLGLDIDAVDTVCDWLYRSRVAWSLDADHRKGFDVPGIAENGFAWAVDRMIAGYLMSEESGAEAGQGVRLADGTELLPLGGIHGPDAQALGALDVLLREIQAWCALAGKEKSPAEWGAELESRLDALLRIDVRDADAREAWNSIRQIIRQPELETSAAYPGEAIRLHYAVVQEILLERMARVPDKQRFLMAGITFCGMVPQRAVPFRMLAVLGLNEGEFPRNRSDGGLDPMTRLRRIGDRDVRSDDRYLFLETLMAARDRLHLSYLGESVKDGKPRNPAAPLAELMAELDARAGSDAPRPWLVRHPLQPFDGRYFDGGDPRLFSYSAAYCAMTGKGDSPLPFRVGGESEPSGYSEQLSLQEVCGFYKDPAGSVLKNHLKLRLEATDDDRLPDSEPLTERLEPKATVARRVFFEQVLAKGLDSVTQPDWVRLGGMLPLGNAGIRAWQAEQAAVMKAKEILAALPWPLVSDGTPERQCADISIAIEIGDASCVLAGRIGNVYPMAEPEQGLVMLRMFSDAKNSGLKSEADLHFGERIPVFLEWAALRLVSPETLRIRVALLCNSKDGTPWQDSLNRWEACFAQAEASDRAGMIEGLKQRLRDLLVFRQSAMLSPPLYFPRTSWVAVSVGGENPEGKVQEKWAGSKSRPGEQHYSSGYARYLAGEIDFEADDEAFQELCRHASMLKGCIEFPEDGP